MGGILFCLLGCQGEICCQEEENEGAEAFDTLRSADIAAIMQEPLSGGAVISGGLSGMMIKSPTNDEFTSLRSEDLNMIMSEPLGTREWEKCDSMR